MQILIATAFAIPHVGGASTHIQLLIRGLRARGHEVRLVEGGQAGCSLAQRLMMMALSGGKRDGYRAARVRQQVAALGRLIGRAVRERRPDVIHAHDPYAGAAAVAAARGIPLVETVHGPALYEARMASGTGFEKYYKQIEQVERTAFSAADRLLPVDSGQGRILMDDYGVLAGKIRVMVNCVDVDEVRELAAKPSELVPGGAYFLVPRRLVPKTGVRFAIEAMGRLRDKSAQLIIAGDGQQRGELEGLARNLGLTERVRFLGGVERTRVMPLFAGAVAVIVPSVPSEGVVEATSLAVTEAMAAGTVPLASGIGGLAELIDHDETGILVPPGDSDALATAMDGLSSDASNRERLIRAATEKVEKDFSLRAWVDRIEEVYAACRQADIGVSAA